MKRLRLLSLLVSCLVTTIITTAQQSFTAGNIVVYRVGDGTAGLTTNSSKVFLDEYTPSGGLVQSIEMPSTGQKLTLPGSGAADFSFQGLITLSSNGQYIMVPGYNVDLGASPYTFNGGAMERSIAVIGYNGMINSLTILPQRNPPSQNALRCVASDNGTNLWLAGDGLGIEYCQAGAGSTVFLGGGAAGVGINITEGQLYVGINAGNINTVGTGLPVSGTQTLTAIPGYGNTSPRQFAFADLDPGVPGVDVLYVTQNAAGVGGLAKWSLVGGVWVSNGVIGLATDRYQGLTIKVQGNSVTTFATRIGGNGTSIRGGQLVSLTDNSGYNATITGTPTVLADVTTRFGTADFAAFRGVALVPQAPSVKVSAKIFLQGAYSTSLTRHKDVSATWAVSLNANALTQPYNTAAFGSYAGTETVAASFFAATAGTTDITDWVLVELRDATTPATVIARRAAFVREDGRVVDLDGVSDVDFPNVNNGNYFIVIRHRNHLGVRSSSAVALSGTATTYDYTTGQAQAYQNPAIVTNVAMKELTAGTVFGMWGGNGNSNISSRASGGLSLNDYLYLTSTVLGGNISLILGPPSSAAVYNSADMNMDGAVRASGGLSLNDYLFLTSTVLGGNISLILNQHL